LSTSGESEPPESDPTAVPLTKPEAPGQPSPAPPSASPYQYQPPQQQAFTPYAPQAGQRRRMGAGRIIVIVLASLLALFGLAVAAGGGALAWAHNSRDSQGFLTTDPEQFSTPTAVLASDGVDIDISGNNWFAKHLGTLRITATSRNGKPIFIGIAPVGDVRAWLGPAAHDQVNDLEVDPFSVKYLRQPGAVLAVSAPVPQTFWTVRSTGGATQVLNWKITGGQWAIVIANADGSPGVDVNARLGAKLSWLGPLSITLIVAGLVLFVIAIVIIVLAVRGRRKALPAWPTQGPGVPYPS
jgi:hypothetical protein